MGIRLYVKDQSRLIGAITAEQLETLNDLLEEEDSQDHDYYVDRDILDFLEEEGADAELIALLRPHIPEGDGVEIQWREEP